MKEEGKTKFTSARAVNRELIGTFTGPSLSPYQVQHICLTGPARLVNNAITEKLLSGVEDPWGTIRTFLLNMDTLLAMGHEILHKNSTLRMFAIESHLHITSAEVEILREIEEVLTTSLDCNYAIKFHLPRASYTGCSI